MSQMKYFIYAGIISLLMVVVKNSYANTNVEIKGSGEGSSSHVSVSNSVHSSTSSQSTSQNRTDIRMETNGQVKEYHGNGNEDIQMNSDGGENSVSFTNKTSTPSASPTATASANATPSANSQIKRETHFDLFEYLGEKFKLFMKIFGYPEQANSMTEISNILK